MKSKVWLMLLTLGIGNLIAANPPSAFDARGIAEKKVGESLHGKVVQMRGIQSAVGIHPTTWRILFWDATASQNGRSVTVKDGAVSEIKDGYMELEHLRLAAYKQEEIIDPLRIKLDSSSVLQKVMKMPALKGIKLNSVEFFLSKNDGDVQPVWHLNLFVDHKGKQVEIGQLRMSAESGEVFEMTLQLEKLK